MVKGVETPFLRHLKYSECITVHIVWRTTMIWLAPADTFSHVSCPSSFLTVSCVTHWPSFGFHVYTKSFLVSGSWHMTIPATYWAPLPRLYLGTPLFSVVCFHAFSSDNLLPLTWDTLVMISTCVLYVYFIDVCHSLNVCVWMKSFA